MREVCQLANTEMWFGTLLLLFVACALLSRLRAHDSANGIYAGPQKSGLDSGDGAVQVGKFSLKDKQNMATMNGYKDDNANKRRWRMQSRQNLFSIRQNDDDEIENKVDGLIVTKGEYWENILRDGSKTSTLARRRREMKRRRRRMRMRGRGIVSAGDYTIQKHKRGERGDGDKDIGQADETVAPLFRTSVSRVRRGVDLESDHRPPLTTRSLSHPRQLSGESYRRARRGTLHKHTTTTGRMYRALSLIPYWRALTDSPLALLSGGGGGGGEKLEGRDNIEEEEEEKVEVNYRRSVGVKGKQEMKLNGIEGGERREVQETLDGKLNEVESEEGEQLVEERTRKNDKPFEKEKGENRERGELEQVLNRKVHAVGRLKDRVEEERAYYEKRIQHEFKRITKDKENSKSKTRQPSYFHLRKGTLFHGRRHYNIRAITTPYQTTNQKLPVLTEVRQGHDKGYNSDNASVRGGGNGGRLIGSRLFHASDNISQSKDVDVDAVGKNSIFGTSSNARTDVSLNPTSGFQDGGVDSSSVSDKDLQTKTTTLSQNQDDSSPAYRRRNRKAENNIDDDDDDDDDDDVDGTNDETKLKLHRTNQILKIDNDFEGNDNNNNGEEEEIVTSESNEEDNIPIWRQNASDHRHVIYDNSQTETLTRYTRSAKTSEPFAQSSKAKAQTQSTNRNAKSIRARREGDAIIGALFPLHETPTQKTAFTRQCGKIREYYGIQRVEAFLMTVENINNDQSILPGIRLGWDIRDSCWYSAIALENSIDFIKDAIASQAEVVQKAQGQGRHHGDDPIGSGEKDGGESEEEDGGASSTEFEQSSGVSGYNGSQSGGSSSSMTQYVGSSQLSSKNHSVVGLTKGCVQKAHLKPIAGLVGPGSSEATLQVQNLLQIFNIPQIGYSATSIDLSDKSHYKYFLRVVPPDRYQAQALVDVVVNFNWTYISTVHSDGNYGIKGMEMFTDLAREKGVCTATIDNVASTAGEEAFDEVVTNLLKTPNATVVVCFCEGRTVENLLKALRRRQLDGRFTIVGSDGWGNRLDVVEGHESTAVGGISIKLYSPPFRNFSSHYSQLRPDRSKENPWFHSFWEQKFNCTLGKDKQGDEDDEKEEEVKENLRGNLCTGRESLSGSDQDSKLGFVVNAVTTMARALHNMREELCPGSKGLCRAMDPINGSVYLDYLLNVSFSDYSNEFINFDENGDPPGRYEILNYQRVASSDGNVSYEYVTVGHWMTGKLNLDEKKMQWSSVSGSDVTVTGKRPAVKSVCSEPCGKDQAKKVKGVECCWICATCLANQILVKNNTDCQTCQLGFWPNDNKTDCEIIPEEFISWHDTQAIVCLAIGGLGVCWTIWVAVIFIRFHDTPVVKASTRELSYIILVGIGLAFCVNVFIVAKPKREFCYLTRILPGLSFSLIYGALVTKTNRIARILEGSKRISTKKPRFMSASAQVVITGMIIGMECAVITGMLIYQPANSKLHYPEPRRVRLVCDTSTLGIVVPLGFDLVLILLCTIYAVKTRNLPENFNEAKFIGFTMYATCVIWLGFFPIYFAGENKEVTLSLSVSLSAAIALLLLFVPKPFPELQAKFNQLENRVKYVVILEPTCLKLNSSEEVDGLIMDRIFLVYVIIWVPERNTRGAFATSRDVRCHIGSKSMASGDSIDIKESSTYDNLFKSDKSGANSRQWKQKSLDEKRLRFVMQRVSDPERSNSYVNHGVINKKTHLASCGILTKISKDSTRTETSHVSTCSEKDRDRDRVYHQNEASTSELTPTNRSSKPRPASPSEKEKHRIHTASRDDQQLLENIKMAELENCRIVPVPQFRKSLSSTCVSSSGPKTRNVHCQTSDDLAQSLLPALRRRRCPSGGKNRLVRSSAVDDANCEMVDSCSRGDNAYSSSHRKSSNGIGSPKNRRRSRFSGHIPYVLEQSSNPSCVCGGGGGAAATGGGGGGGGGGSSGARLSKPLPKPNKAYTLSSRTNNNSGCGRSNHTCNSQVSSHRQKSPSLSPFTTHEHGDQSQPSLTERIIHTESCPLNEVNDQTDSFETRSFSSEDEPCCSCNVTEAPPSSCHRTTRHSLHHPSHNNSSTGSGGPSFPPSSFFQPIHGSCSHSISISSASSSSTLPPFNTSTESTKSNHSCYAPSDPNEEMLNFISMETDEEEDEDDVDELSPLRMESMDSKGSNNSESANAPLQIFAQEESDMIEFQRYLKSHGVKLDLSSVQSSDL